MFGFTKVWAMLSTASSVPGSPLELFFFVFFLFFQWFYKHFIENVWFYQGLGNKLLTNCASRTPVQGHKVPPQTSSVPGSPLELFFFVFFCFFNGFTNISLKMFGFTKVWAINCSRTALPALPYKVTRCHRKPALRRFLSPFVSK